MMKIIYIMLCIKLKGHLYLVNDHQLNFCRLTKDQMKTIVAQLLGLRDSNKCFSVYKYWLFATYFGGRRKKSRKKVTKGVKKKPKKKLEEDEEYIDDSRKNKDKIRKQKKRAKDKLRGLKK